MAMNDRSACGMTPSDPAVGAVAIDVSVSDQTLNPTARGIYVTAAGTFVVIMLDGSTATFSGLLAGFVYPFAVRGITKIGTTATGIALR